MSEPSPIAAILQDARRELLDLSTRNRLLNTPKGRSRSATIEIARESADEIFRLLAIERKSLAILPRREQADGAGAGSEAPPTETEIGDLNLRTSLEPEVLDKKLLRLYTDGRTFEEEQGISILYLAIGFLRWYEARASQTPRCAPLILVPVMLERKSAQTKFKLVFRDDELATNLTLQEKLGGDFRMQLPPMPAVDQLVPSEYFDEVRKAVKSEPRWEVSTDEMTLGLFSFAKLLMFKDLDPATWPEGTPLASRDLLAGLLGEGFAATPPLCGDDDPIDPLIPSRDAVHVVDADSSQTIAIEEGRRGRNLVIQGPPGTGKSQTICNLIAGLARSGKRVLFVAEKMAALEVVKRRLDSIGLGPMCLELHSQKARKTYVLADLKQTLALHSPKLTTGAQVAEDLDQLRDRLNAHSARMNEPLQPAGISPFAAIGSVARYQSQGGKLPDFELANAATWPAAERSQKVALLEELAEHIGRIGKPEDNCWRGVGWTSMDPLKLERIVRGLPELRDKLLSIHQAALALAEMLQVPPPTTLLGVQQLGQLVQWIQKAPPGLDRQAYAGSEWSTRRPQIAEVLERGKHSDEVRARLSEWFSAAGLSTDLTAQRAVLAKRGWIWRQFLSGEYRSAMKAVRQAGDRLPRRTSELLSAIDQLREWQTGVRDLDEGASGSLGRAAFGSAWAGAASDWECLERIDGWDRDGEKLGSAHREACARVKDSGRLGALIAQVRPLGQLFKALVELLGQLELKVVKAFGNADLREVSLDTLLKRLDQWRENRDGLSHWVAYQVRRSKASAVGLKQVADLLHRGQIAAEDLLSQFELAYSEQLLREAFRQRPELNEFDGRSHEQLIARFRDLETQRRQLARAEVAHQHWEALPSGSSGIGEIGVVQRELEKKRNLKPIRQLLREAGRTVQAIKPVFMMSPITVAQYLEPGKLDFDVVVIDEASQVRPVDALGAMARAQQMIVVGDDKQLPPTSFFSSVLADDDDETAEVADRAGDLESILGMCRAKGVAQRTLRWHYRSRHHSLIAVSNREFYDSRLYVVPSAARDPESLGLAFRHVPNGVFDRGKSSTNAAEAVAVVEAIVEHAKRSPDRSLGVGTFSAAQRDAILDRLEEARQDDVTLEQFCSQGGDEPFFVKNLENIQGDERDVIFISVGYGRDADGRMTMNFGPLQTQGGERRLNVLISRARMRCEVFASITDADIDLRRAQSRGAAAFRTFLRYARTGELDIASPTFRDHDSDFEAQVAQAIRDQGFEVEPQVAEAGFFIDLAIIDPELPGRYVLGIECDGASYHSARSARDRDRLRQQVLEDRGWTVHRIWSTDWFRAPTEELRRVLLAIDGAREAMPTVVAPEPEPELARHNAKRPATNGLAVPYVETTLKGKASGELADQPPSQLLPFLVQIVRTEGPVHSDEVTKRLTTFWGYQRAGSRIAAAVAVALRDGVRQGAFVADGEFYSMDQQADVPIRNREQVASVGLRRLERLPPQEVSAALQKLVRTHEGATEDEITGETARLLGFRRGSQLSALIERELDALIEMELIRREEGRLRFVGQASSDGGRG